jgi:ketosteroid isomerase-like protein
MTLIDSSIQRWLSAFALAVRSRDFAAGRALCDTDVVGFGTVANHVTDLRSLEHDQWRQVWERTSDFEFDPGSASFMLDGNLACVAALWHSNGFDARGASIVRYGRATIVLRRGNDDSWRAVHTHFSLTPQSIAGQSTSRVAGMSSHSPETTR